MIKPLIAHGITPFLESDIHVILRAAYANPCNDGEHKYAEKNLGINTIDAIGRGIDGGQNRRQEYNKITATLHSLFGGCLHYPVSAYAYSWR
jgi:hypothetical protein